MFCGIGLSVGDSIIHVGLASGLMYYMCIIYMLILYLDLETYGSSLTV